MATEILPVAATPNQVVAFTLSADTLVWVHGATGDAELALNIKGSDGKVSPLGSMQAFSPSKSGVLPAGDYEVIRVKGTCGLQRA